MKVLEVGISVSITALDLSFAMDQHIGTYGLKKYKNDVRKFDIIDIVDMEDKKVRPEQVHGHYRKFDKTKHR